MLSESLSAAEIIEKNMIKGWKPVRVAVADIGTIKPLDEAFMTSLYAQINSLYRLDQIGSQQGSIDTKADLGPLPGTAVTLLCALGTVWVLIGLYVLRRALKAKKD